ncbi:hypothetical protein [Persephonella sp.]
MVETTEAREYDSELQGLEQEIDAAGFIDIDLKKIPLKVLRRYFLGKPYEISPLQFRVDKTGKRYPLKVRISKTSPPQIKKFDYSKIEADLIEPPVASEPQLPAPYQPTPKPVSSREFNLLFGLPYFTREQRWLEMEKAIGLSKQVEAFPYKDQIYLMYSYITRSKLSAEAARSMPFLETTVWYEQYQTAEIEKQKAKAETLKKEMERILEETREKRKEKQIDTSLGHIQEEGKKAIKEEEKKTREENIIKRTFSKAVSFVKRLFRF